MTDSEITALVREYVEEKGKEMEQKQRLPNCLIKEVMEMDAEELTCFLKWLLCRYCLVEKEAVEAKYQEAKERYFNPDDEIEKTMYGGRMSMLEYLFPEIAKEVEG